jgi:hypothetical protein
MSSISTESDSRSTLDRIVAMSKRKTGIQLPVSLIRDSSGETPLHKLFSGGQGGEVRLKLYLTLLLLATKAPYKIKRSVPARVWAEAIGLKDPEGSGKRRVADALNWLHKEGFIELERHAGEPPQIQILNIESGGKWKRPSWPYVKLPLNFWSEYQIHDLSGRAIVVMLALLELTGGKDRSRTQSIGRTRSKEYGLSSETMARGSNELESSGIIKTSFGVQGEKDLDWQRRRKLYTVIEVPE